MAKYDINGTVVEITREKYACSPAYRLWRTGKYSKLFLAFLCVVGLCICWPVCYIAEVINDLGNACTNEVTQWRKLEDS